MPVNVFKCENKRNKRLRTPALLRMRPSWSGHVTAQIWVIFLGPLEQQGRVITVNVQSHFGAYIVLCCVKKTNIHIHIIASNNP